MFQNDNNYNEINSKYLGYIEYSNMKIEIVKGINYKNLYNHHVCLDSESISLDNNVNKLLAGHSTDDVFQKLHKIKIGDMVKIVTSEKEYIYVVDNINIVGDNDINAIKKDSNLTLITCMINPHKRLIIKASLV